MSAAAPALSDHDHVVAAHARHYLALLAREAPRLNGAGKADGGWAQMRALKRLSLDLGNLLEALDNALESSRVEWLLILATHLRLFLDRASEFRQQYTSYTSLQEAAARLDSPELQLQVMLGLSAAQLRLGQVDTACATTQTALALASRLDDQGSQALALRRLATAEYIRGNPAGARGLHEQALAGWRLVGDRAGVALSLGGVGLMHFIQGEHGPARTLLGEALALQRRIGERFGEASSLNNLGLVEFVEGRHDEARQLFEQALAIERDDGGSQRGEADAVGNLALLADLRGNYGQARELLERALAIQHNSGDRVGESASYHNLGQVHCRQGDYPAAAQCIVRALRIKLALGSPAGLLSSAMAGALALAGLGRLSQAALVLHGVQAGAARVGCQFDPPDSAALESVDRQVAAAVAQGAIGADEYAQLQQAAAELGVEELAQTALLALEAAGGKA